MDVQGEFLILDMTQTLRNYHNPKEHPPPLPFIFPTMPTCLEWKHQENGPEIKYYRNSFGGNETASHKL